MIEPMEAACNGLSNQLFWVGTMSHKLTRHCLDSLSFYLSIILLFLSGRSLFLLQHLDRLGTQDYSIFDIARVFFYGSRYDSAISAYFAAFYFVIFLFLQGRFVAFGKRIYSFLTIVCLWVLVVCDYSFYNYYGDHFNTFFWEFWNNASNAKLVVASVWNEFPVLKISLTLILGCFVFLKIRTFLRNILFSLELRRIHSQPLFTFIGTLFLLAFLCRSTFGKPLTIQDRRVDITAHTFLNIAHRNPIFPLYNSYMEKESLMNLETLLAKKPSEIDSIYSELKKNQVGSSLQYDEKKQLHKIQYDVKGRLGQILTKKPKHIVILFLESYSSWPLFDRDEGFSKELTEGMRSLIPDSIYFENHFSAADGTLKNIGAVNYGFPLPPDFNPSLSYRPESFKNFDSKLPNLIKNQNYSTQFFYGGFSNWHRLYEFVPRIGYDHFFSEGSFPDIPHHDFGLHDEDLYQQVLLSLKSKKENSFTFVMTQSNHPPYRIPEHFDSKDVRVPEHIQKIITTDAEEFRMRMLCFKYADRALANFMKEARKEEFFKDTLFIITGDHPFYGLHKNAEDYFAMSNVPLLFYAPELIRPTWKGKHFTKMSNHLDIAPSIISLISDKNILMDTWGMDLFSEQKRDMNLNFYIDCKDEYCLVDRDLFALKDRRLQKVTDPSLEDAVKNEILRAQKAYFYSGLSYLHRF